MSAIPPDVAVRLASLSADKRELLARKLAARRAESLAGFAASHLAGAPPQLSFAQERLWFLDQLGGLGAAYHVPWQRKLTGQLDPAALRWALDRIVARHEILRTTFEVVQGKPVQRIHPAGGSRFTLGDHDLRHRPDAVGELRALVREEETAPFDLSRGPLVRGRLIRLRDDEHLLLITRHHMVTDAWSTGVFVAELVALYRAHVGGDPDPLPPLPTQYADFAVWQRAGMASGALAGDADYWMRSLAGAPALLELPADRPRLREQEHAGDFVPIRLDAEQTGAVGAASEAHGVTMFMFLLAAWAAVLSRLSGRDDVVVGVPVANRGHTELEGLIGLFVNTLPMRIDLAGRPTVADLLARVKAVTLAAQQHQQMPLEQIVELAQPERSLSYNPLFQAMFSWRGPVGDVPAWPGIRVEHLPPDIATGSSTALVDVSLHFREADGALAGGIEYATSLFDRGTIERIAVYLSRLVSEMAADPARPVALIDLLPPDERRRVLRGPRGETRASVDCLGERFESQVRATPEATAVTAGETALTYAELNARANRVAHALRARGVRPDDRVAVATDRGTDTVVAILGVLKAGAAYVPIDVSHPDERIRFVLGDSGPRAVLVDGGMHGRIAALATGRTVLQVAQLAAATDLPITNPERAAVGLSPANLAYIIYTSGSTGQPKGVAVAHEQVTRLLDSTDEWFRFGPADAWTLFHSVAFDFSVWEIFGALLTGGRLVVVSYATSRAPEEFYGLLCRERVTVLNQTPSAFRQLSATQESLGTGAPAHALRLVIFGGEALDVAMLAPWYARGTNADVRLVNMYGITETTVHVTYRPLTAADARHDGASPIGEPIPDLHCYVLDAYGQPVPVGVAGELYVGGAGLSRGYLGRPGLTAERFVPDPFSSRTGARLYRSGDVARWRSDGRLEYQGRNDQQVKVRGFRIELGEIEARLASAPGVRAALVVARDYRDGDQRLVAYYVPDPAAGAPDADTLRRHMDAVLPEYMIPAAYVPLTALPLTPNGKLDRSALPAPDMALAAHAAREFEPPVGEAEGAIAAVWAELLQVHPVGRHDNFFSLGGHSLLAITLIERLRARGYQVGVRTLFTNPTVADLAAAMRPANDAPSVPPGRPPAGCARITPDHLSLVSLTQAGIDWIVARVPGGAANVQDIYPLAPLQEGILFHHLCSLERDPYVVSQLLSFDTRARLDAFLHAFQAVVARHDILRTAVLWEELDDPVQVVWRSAELAVEEVSAADIQAFVASEAGEPAQDGLSAHEWPPFELDRAPLVRAFVAHVAADGDQGERWLLLLQQHHIIGDHVTLDVVWEEIEAHLLGRERELPPPAPFRAFVARVRDEAAGASHERFFTELLSDVRAPTALFGITEVPVHARMRDARRRVPGDVARRIRELSRALGVSAASVCHAAWARALAGATRCDDVVFGTVLVGRLDGDTDAGRTLGLLINTLPFRLRVNRGDAASDVRDAQVLLGELLGHQHASLSVAQRCSGVAPPQPLLSTLLNYRHNARLIRARSPEARRMWDGVRAIASSERTNYPVLLSVDDTGDAFLLSAQAAAPGDAERVCDLMETAMVSLADELESRRMRHDRNGRES